MQKQITVGYGSVAPVLLGGDSPLAFIGGPCAIESREHALRMADQLSRVCRKLDVPFIYKSCYDKDCRSSPDSFHGCGIDVGLEILLEIRDIFGIPVTADFSDPAWAEPTGEVCDLVQVPAYLCRQTSILRAAAKTGRPVHLKKGQFMSPWNMQNSVKKLEASGATEIILTDRGTFFGYNSLVNDMRSFRVMGKTGYPVGYDATHSIQMPTSTGKVSGGQREFVPALVRAAVAAGIDVLFMEVHDSPDAALSDPHTQLDLRHLEFVLTQAKRLHEVRLELKQQVGANPISEDAWNYEG